MHLCMDKANSVVEVRCRNLFLRLGMKPVSLSTTEPPEERGHRWDEMFCFSPEAVALVGLGTCV